VSFFGPKNQKNLVVSAFSRLRDYVDVFGFWADCFWYCFS
jgi:hypothetical protein